MTCGQWKPTSWIPCLRIWDHSTPSVSTTSCTVYRVTGVRRVRSFRTWPVCLQRMASSRFHSSRAGGEAEHPLALSEAYNRLGAFHNRDDDYDGLVEALRVSFGRVEVSQVGNVALFVASKPKRASFGDGGEASILL